MSARQNGRLTRGSIRQRLQRLTISAILPLLLFVFLLIGLFLAYNHQSEKISQNITTASQFSRDFKADVDLKMYCFVAGSTDETPSSEVREARQLATTLLESTSNLESRQLINTVLNLCDTLDNSIREIEQTESYDERMSQLENNIYIITSLIQNYIYDYLFSEAIQMSEMQANLELFTTVFFAAATLVLAGLVILSLRNSSSISRSIVDPIDDLSERVEQISSGDLSSHEPVETNDSQLQTLSDGIEQMVGQINSQLELNEKEQIKLREMEFALLQAQINPHFLYNTLDTIIWLIETGKNEQAQDMVSSLSTYFRSFLSNGKDIITLAEEITHVKSYLEIQQVRYKDILSYDILADNSFGSCAIPKMTLQPLVENAIYHGIKTKRGGGSITVSSEKENDKVLIRVSDTGSGLTPERLEELRSSLNSDGGGFGLSSSYKRLKLRYGENCSFDIDSEAGVGTVISIRIPAEEQEANA